MRKFIFICLNFIFVLGGLLAQSTKFKGTMQVGNYTRENVVVEVFEQGNKLNCIMYNVKFSRFMPITVDLKINGLQKKIAHDTTFVYGSNIIPMVKQTQYEKYIIKKLNATIVKQKLTVNTFLGEKKLTYWGKQIQ